MARRIQLLPIQSNEPPTEGLAHRSTHRADAGGSELQRSFLEGNPRDLTIHALARNLPAKNTGRGVTAGKGRSRKYDAVPALAESRRFPGPKPTRDSRS